MAYLARHGRGKVLFGTNWPMISPKKALDGFDALELSAEGRELFLSGNAMRVYRLDAPRA